MITISPKDSPIKGDITLDGVTDVTVLSREFAKSNKEYQFLDGTVNLNGGTNASTNDRNITIGAGTKIIGSDGTVFVASTHPCRWHVRGEGVVLRNLKIVGFVQINNYSNNFTGECIDIEHSFDGKTFASWKGKGGCVGAIQNWVAPGKVMKNVTYRNCRIAFSWHHGMGFHIQGAQQGAWWENILIEACDFISCGSGVSGNDKNGTQDWSTGVDFDTGSMRNVTIRGCYIFDSYQSGYHTDGHWNNHEQQQINVVFEDCVAEQCGVRAFATKLPSELYCSGFYVQDAQLIRCRTINCAKSGIHAKAGYSGKTLRVIDCSDVQSAYGLVAEYSLKDIIVENFTSDGATVRAVQTTAANSKFINVKILNYTKNDEPVLLGRTERLEYVGAPKHVKDLARYVSLGYNMSTSTFDFAFDREMTFKQAIEVNAPSSVDPTKVTIRVAIPTPIEPPVEPPVEHIRRVVKATLEYDDGTVQHILA